MGKRKRGRAAKQARAALGVAEPDAVTRAPHSFVFHRGPVGRYVRALVGDLRKVCEPYTAVSLKVRKSNTLKDFVSVAGPLGVTHMLILTKSPLSVNLRLIRVPHGPTLCFKVLDYSLAKDVVSAQRRPVSFEKQFNHEPLVVMNGFKTDKEHLKVTQTMFQNMFPPININTIDLKTVKRCVLLSYSEEDDSILFRHYTVKPTPVGMSKSAKKLLKNKKVPNLGRYKDISEYFETLVELGPRLRLKLIKIENGIDSGEVLYHAFQEKTPEEISELEKRLKNKRNLKLKRRARQDANVARKKKQKQEHSKKCLEGMGIPVNEETTED